jgi:hypothetical protein
VIWKFAKKKKKKKKCIFSAEKKKKKKLVERTGGSVGSPACGKKTPAAGCKVQDGGPRVGAQWS